MEVNIPNVPACINNGPEYFVLESLNYSNVARFCAPPIAVCCRSIQVSKSVYIVPACCALSGPIFFP